MNVSGTGLIIREYSGGLELTNHTGVNDDISVDVNSGHIIIDSSVTSGTFVIRGVGKLTNNSTGTTVVQEEILDSRNLNRSTFADGAVHFNSNSLESGTGFPLGTPARPVNDLADALTIATENGLHKIDFIGFATATAVHDLTAITIKGGSGSSNVLILAGCSTNTAAFEQMIITGALNGLARIKDCVMGTTGLGGMTGIEGRVVDCIINHTDGLVQNPTGAGTLFDNCSFIAPNNPQITLDANGKGFSLRGCTGSILVKNKTEIEAGQVQLAGAEIEFDSSCTAGSFAVEGHGSIIDNSAGTTITNNLVSTDTIWGYEGP